LRAISIHAPHAYAICIGLKNEEYRTKLTNYRGWALIHSSGSKASDDCFQDYFIDPVAIGVKRYAIIGAAEIYDCLGQPRDYRYLLRNAIAFSTPIEGIKGQQSIFWGKSDKYPERTEAFNNAWAMLQARLR
jgi:hypothetical protein